MPASPVRPVPFRPAATFGAAAAALLFAADAAAQTSPYGTVTIEHAELAVSPPSLLSDEPATGRLASGGLIQVQAGPPVRLAPLPSGTSASPPLVSSPAVRQPAPAPRPLGTSGITVDPLSAPSLDGLGVLGPNDRPLPATLWQGTSRTAAETLLPRIRPSTSPMLQDLAYRLLASPAAAPAAERTVPTDPGALLALRAERLTALGRADSALALLQSAPAASAGEDATRVVTDLAFLSGDTRTACATAHSRDPAWQGPYWDLTAVTCQALAGQADQAQLGLDMLREAKVKDDGFSAVVLKAIGVDTRLPDDLPAPQTMSLALFDKIGEPLPKKALDGASLAVLRAVALGTGFPADQRLIAAEKAAAYGAIGPQRLAEAYLAVELGDEDRESPLNRAKATGGARGRAILFRAAHDAGPVAAKANFLVAYLGDPKSELYPALVRAASALMVEVPASPELAPVAPDFARALYALDQPEAARTWFDVAPPDAQAALLPLAHIVAGDTAPPWAGDGLADLAGGKKDAAAPRRAATTALLLAAEGAAVPDKMLLPLADPNAASLSTPPVGPAALLANAAGAGRLGGTVLAVLANAGDQGLAAQPLAATRAVAALRQIGLKDEARRLAIDIAVAEGL